MSKQQLKANDIRTKPSTKEYDEGWDRIFGKNIINLRRHLKGALKEVDKIIIDKEIVDK